MTYDEKIFMETIPIAQFYVKLTVIIQIYTILLLEWKQIQELKILVKRHPGQRAFAADGAALTAAAVSDGDSTKAGSGLGGAK